MIPPTRIYNKQLMNCGMGRGLSVGVGQAIPNDRVCMCFSKVWPYYMNLFRSNRLFLTGHCHAPFYASWPKRLISFPFSFSCILCKSVNPFGSYAPFCNRPIPLPHPLLRTPFHTFHLQISASQGKNCGIQSVQNFFSDQPTKQQGCWSASSNNPGRFLHFFSQFQKKILVVVSLTFTWTPLVKQSACVPDGTNC